MWQTVAFAKLKSLSFSRVSDRTLGTFVEVPLLRFGHEIFGGVLLLRMRKTQVLPKSPANPIHGKKRKPKPGKPSSAKKCPGSPSQQQQQQRRRRQRQHVYMYVYNCIYILLRYEHLSSRLSLFGTVPLRDTVYGPSSGLFSLLGNLYTAYTALSLMSPTQSLNYLNSDK